MVLVALGKPINAEKFQLPDALRPSAAMMEVMVRADRVNPIIKQGLGRDSGLPTVHVTEVAT